MKKGAMASFGEILLAIVLIIGGLTVAYFTRANAMNPTDYVTKDYEANAQHLDYLRQQIIVQENTMSMADALMIAQYDETVLDLVKETSAEYFGERWHKISLGEQTLFEQGTKKTQLIKQGIQNKGGMYKTTIPVPDVFGGTVSTILEVQGVGS